jgi:riboflavin synthase alpha subunit
MFTGIIQAVGTLAGMQLRGGDMRLHISTGKLELASVQLGDSIATNGVCLTVVELPGDGYVADVSRETLALSTLSSLAPGARVNLEKALTLNTPLGGHLVSAMWTVLAGFWTGGTMPARYVSASRLRQSWPATLPIRDPSVWMVQA